MLNPTKKCSNPNCSQINPQPLTHFNKNRAKKDGLYIYCRICHRNANNSWGSRNPEKKQDFYRHWYEGNPQRNRDKDKESYKSNPIRKKTNNKKWAKINPSKINSKEARRRAKKLNATPKWLTKEQLREIQDFYDEAARLTKETGIKHHVDHILPFQGEGVTGLHVPWNLQILTESENVKKNNKFDFTYDNESWRIFPITLKRQSLP